MPSFCPLIALLRALTVISPLIHHLPHSVSSLFFSILQLLDQYPPHWNIRCSCQCSNPLSVRKTQKRCRNFQPGLGLALHPEKESHPHLWNICTVTTCGGVTDRHKCVTEHKPAFSVIACDLGNQRNTENSNNYDGSMRHDINILENNSSSPHFPKHQEKRSYAWPLNVSVASQVIRVLHSCSWFKAAARLHIVLLGHGGR